MAKRLHSVKRQHGSGADGGGRIGYGSAMTTENERQARARAERLAAALRANLRKRKGLGGRADPLADQHPAPETTTEAPPAGQD